MLALTACFVVLCILLDGTAALDCNPEWRKPDISIKLSKLKWNRQARLPDPVDPETLKLVHVVFRHGDRTADADAKYPNDPYFNETYYPVGYGQLTNLGKKQEYNIGMELRNRYGSFLGDVYTEDVIDPRSTDYSRTKMSLDLVLAGLWPPTEEQTWNTELKWQPIAYNYMRAQEDELLGDPHVVFPKFAELFDDNLESEENQAENEILEDFYKYLRENTGINFTSPVDVYNLFFTLFAEEHWGFVLPEWTKCVWPIKISEVATKFYSLMTETRELRSYSTGNLLEKIIKDSKDMSNGKLEPEDRKMFLYSSHERNVALALISLNVFYPHVPSYASYVVIEFHKIDGVYGFKILYRDYRQNEPMLLTIPECDTFCPYDKFYELLKNNLPLRSSLN